ncbi:MAG: gliding motility lipoprotein GldH [Muribaculaceae bacterium]|nr:gliding motility lipoprotein GldH [Muribaculaceae bacterium]MDE7111431.1 gliding motility lipoprotein GldH [Muribaculaceae bacterium]
MTIRLRNKWFSLTFFGLLASCSAHDNDYSAFSTINSEGWEYGHTYVYRPTIADSLANGLLRVAVRHTNDYPFRNLWLEVSYQIEAPDSTISFRADTINITLADPYGNWLGRGLGTTFQKADTVRTDFRLIPGAPIRLRHIMRVERVPELEQVGIIFEKQ